MKFLPVLLFPVAKKLGYKMSDLERSADAQVEALQDEKFPVVCHNCGANVAKAAEAIFAQGAAGYHFGNAISLKDMLEGAPKDVWVMGNVDPVSVLANGTPESVRAACTALRMECGSYQNFVLSSGCDIPVLAPWDNLAAFNGDSRV